MSRESVRWGKAVVAGLVATGVGFTIGFFLYGAMNGVYAKFGELPYAKPIRSVPAYLAQMFVGSAILNVLFAGIYGLIQEGLPGKRRWRKGLAFGAILLATNMLPIAFNTWMQIAQPPTLILVEAVNRTIGLLVQGVAIALVYGPPLSVHRSRENRPHPAHP
ncbi:MAG: hypothetical protein ACLFU8_16890 [Anaerolineales bacterium]